MTFTYDGTLDTDLEKVRLLIGDTDSTAALFQDAEITHFLTVRSSNLYLAAADACEAAAAKFARAFDFATDGQSFERSKMHDAFLAMAEAFRRRNDAEGLGEIIMTRVDGYSDDIAADEVTGSTTAPRRRYYGQRDLPR